MNDYRTTSGVISRSDAEVDAGLRAHMVRVYGLMGGAMTISALVAYFVGNSSLVYTVNTGILRWVFMFLPLIMIFAMGPVMQRLSYSGARAYFFAFAAAMGISLSYIFAVFSLGSIATTFAATSVGFLALSLWGYTTKKDISGWGSFLLIGVVGLIIASLINIFLQSSGLHFAISAIGVLIFAGLTAYDTQNIKNLYLQQRYATGMEQAGHLAIYGALQLYLDFVNLFTFLLSFLGNQE